MDLIRLLLLFGYFFMALIVTTIAYGMFEDDYLSYLFGIIWPIGLPILLIIHIVRKLTH